MLFFCSIIYVSNIVFIIMMINPDNFGFLGGNFCLLEMSRCLFSSFITTLANVVCVCVSYKADSACGPQLLPKPNSSLLLIIVG